MNSMNNWLHRFHKTPALIILSTEIILGIIISFFVFHIFWEMSETVLAQEKFFFDASVSSYFYEIRNPLLTQFMQFISFIGMDGIIIASIFIPLFFFYKNKKHEAILFTVIISFGVLLNVVLKAATQRPRPDVEAIAVAQFSSFPSGHSMNSFIFFMAIAYFYYRLTRKKVSSVLLFILAAITILLVGISRIYLGVHYPSDVVAGFLAGLLWLLFVLVIDKTIAFFRLFRTN